MKAIKHIHKLFLTASILLLALTLTACSNDKDSDCECIGKYQTANGDYFFVPKQPIDCETRQPTTFHPSGYFVGCVD